MIFILPGMRDFIIISFLLIYVQDSGKSRTFAFKYAVTRCSQIHPLSGRNLYLPCSQ